MSGGEARDMAYRIADRILAGCGITKAAGGAYVAQREAHADAWMPLADALVGAAGGLTRIRERMDENLRVLRGIYAADQARKAAHAQAFDITVRGAGEPHATVPLDPSVFELRAQLGLREDPPHANGHDVPGGAT